MKYGERRFSPFVCALFRRVAPVGPPMLSGRFDLLGRTPFCLQAFFSSVGLKRPSAQDKSSPAELANQM